MNAPAPPADEPPLRNRWDAREWAGALGDLGTLLPFVLGYLAVMRLDPTGVLVGFGGAMVACGWLYRTPLPVQPMKAIGAAALAQGSATVLLGPGAVAAAGLVTGLVWLLLGASGWARRLGSWVSPPVAQGLVLGLGAALVLQAGPGLASGPWVAAAGLALLAAARWGPPALRHAGLPVLLLAGLALGAWQQMQHEPQARATLVATLSSQPLQWRLPGWTWPTLGLQELLWGTVLLALPQWPLTLGNAIVGVRTEHNRLFPQRPVSDRQLALSTGWMNLFGSAVGGVPMCHGAGGLAAHVAFGARTGGAVVILGCALLVLGLGFSHLVQAVFGLLPMAVLGCVLAWTGAQLAAGQLRPARSPQDTALLLVTAAASAWHGAAGLAVGLALQALLHRRARQP